MSSFAGFKEMLSPVWVSKEITEVIEITVSQDVYGVINDYEVVTYMKDFLNPYFVLEVLLLFFFLHILVTLMFKSFFARKR